MVVNAFLTCTGHFVPVQKKEFSISSTCLSTFCNLFSNPDTLLLITLTVFLMVSMFLTEFLMSNRDLGLN